MCAAPPTPRIRQRAASTTALMWSFTTSSIRLLRDATRSARQGNRELRPTGHDHRALHDIAQFPDVSRPLVLLQRGQALARNSLDSLAERCRELVDETPDQQRDVFGAIAERRHVNRKDIQPVVEVVAERAFGDELLEIAMRGGDDTHVDVDARGLPSRSN